MKLTKVQLRSMPGIPQGFTLDTISPGMNIITGPNGIGKTTLCQAILACLWETDAADASVETEWNDGEFDWIAERKHGRLEWYCDGERSLPTLPEKRLAGCIALRVDQMLGGLTESDSELATRIWREMSGGYDLELIRGNTRFKIPSSRPSARLSDALRAIAAAVSIQAELAEQERNLPALRRAKKEAVASVLEAIPLTRALELAQHQADFAACTLLDSNFPQKMEYFQDGDDILLNTREEQVSQSAAEIQKQDQILARLLEDIRKIALPDDLPVSHVDLEEWEQQIALLPALNTHLKNAEQKVRTAEARRLEATSAILTKDAAVRFLATGIQVSPALLLSAQNALDQDLRLEARRRSLERVLALLPDQTGSASPDAVGSGIRLLTRWLSAPEKPVAKFQVLHAVLFGFLTLACLVIAAVAHPVWVQISLGLLSLVAGGGIIIDLLSGRNISSVSANKTAIRHTSESDYRRLTLLPSPTQWTEAAVLDTLDALLVQSGHSYAAEEIKQYRAGIESEDKELSREVNAAKAGRIETERSLGFSLTWKDFDQVWLSRNLAAYQEANNAFVDSQSEADGVRLQITEILTQFNTFHKQFSLNLEATMLNEASARVAFKLLHSRSEQLQHACLRRNEIQAALTDLRRKGVVVAGNLETLLQDRRCENADEMRLCLEHYSDWKNLIGKKELLSKQIKSGKEGLLDRPDLCALNKLQILQKQQEAKDLADKGEGLSDSITRIEMEIRGKKSLTDIGESRVAYDKIVDAIGTKRDEALFATAGQFLLQQTTSRHASTQPGVLEQASSLFQEFTTRYSLRVIGQGPTAVFRAYDSDNGKTLALAELSGGTRIQLLMAARLAFAEQAIGGTGLPLCLDETLKHSDPARYAAIVTCLHRIVASGRQVFYLTNEPMDVTRIKMIFAQHGGEVPNSIDLAEVRGGREGWPPLQEIIPPKPLTIPPPGELSVAEYGHLLNVVRFDPKRPVESCPLFYVLSHDLFKVYELLQAGVTTIGRWESLKTTGHIRLGLTPKSIAEIESWVSLTRLFAEAWNKGRPKSLTKAVLQQAGVPQIFLERICELAQDLDWEAQRLITSIAAGQDHRTKRFRANTLSEMQEWMAEHKYLTEEIPLDASGIVLAVLNDGAAISSPPEQIRQRVLELWFYAEPNSLSDKL